jgi:predicted lipoprotein with Yx(FWY)xxD motif
MCNVRRALIALLPLSVLCVAACGTTAPQAGAAYGPGQPPQATAPAPARGGTVAPAPARGGATGAAAIGLLAVKTPAGYVLATPSGRTVYWYARDVPGSGRSSCATAACRRAWPPVTGTPAAAPGVKLAGTFGTITGNGITQATYDGYPLYTYAGDTAAGQASGNGIGGVWHVFTGSRLAADPAAAAAASARLLSAARGGMPASPSARPASPGPAW